MIVVVDKQFDENATEMPFLLWKLVNQLQKQFPNPVWFYCVWPGHLISTSSWWEQRGNFTSSFTFMCLDKRGTRRAVGRVVWLCAGMGGALPQALGWQLLSSWRKQSHRKSFPKVFGHPTWGISLKMLFEAFIWFCVFIISFFFFFFPCDFPGALTYFFRVQCRKNY